MEMRSWKQSQLPQTRNREKNQRQRRLRTDYGQLFRNRIKEGSTIRTQSGVTARDNSELSQAIQRTARSSSRRRAGSAMISA